MIRAFQNNNQNMYGRPLSFNTEAVAPDNFFPSRYEEFPQSYPPSYRASRQASPVPAPASVPSSVAQKPGKVKQVLPCFNLVCTGTCAYGPKCTFLHDPRAQLPRHVRKQAEFMLQSHLHTYRPNVNKNISAAATASNLQGKDFGIEEDDNMSDCTDSDGSSHANSSLARSLTFRRDDIFSYPTTALSYQEPNAKLYDPCDEQLIGHGREMSMWYHLLANLSEKNIPLALHQEAFNGNKRLSVFQKLSQGRPVM